MEAGRCIGNTISQALDNPLDKRYWHDGHLAYVMKKVLIPVAYNPEESN